jgi:hypothetical protein
MRFKVIYEHLNQKGGSDFYLPCEITHFTKDVYYPYNYQEKLKQYIGLYVERIICAYCQDIYIQLYNGEKYYNITTDKINNLFYKIELYCNNQLCTCSYKENFYPIKKFNRDENIKLDGNIRFWKCDYSEERTNRVDNSFKNDELIGINIDLSKDTIINEQSKGGNYISAPNNTIFYVDGTDIIIDEIKKINPQLKCIKLNCSFKAQKSFRHIDELMCFMPYGINKYKVWFYNELTKNHFDNYSNYTDELIKDINDERLTNLELISQTLFSLSFEECSDYFVFFNFYSWTQSIFNRTWYETPDRCICLFPKLEPDTDAIFKIELINKLNVSICAEMEKVYSYINNRKPEFVDIIVPEVNINKPEGTVHCIIKQRFECV